MFSLNDSPLSDIINTLDTDRFTITDGDFTGAESYIITNGETGNSVRVQATEGEPESLSICTEQNDDWDCLSTDPATAVTQINTLTA